MSEQKIAVLGCGLWGRNIVRNFYNLNALGMVCDLDDDNIAKVKEQYPGIKTTKDFHDILNSKEITGVVVVTPSHTHFKFVKAMLEAGKHVYVEKPISTVAQEARDLTDLADSKGLVLMVGHLLLYHPAVNRLKMLVEEGALGDIVYAQSDRLNINYFKNDRSVMWDLAPHDVSMISYVLGKNPQHVISAIGCSSDGNDIMDITHIGIKMEGGAVAHITDSWITPKKHVQLLVRGTKKTAILDDTVPEHKLTIYDNFKAGSSENIQLDYLEIEPLKLECQHFISCCETGKKARSDGENGFIVVSILEEAEKIMLGDRAKNLDHVDFALSRTKK
ncbi:MAG: Gfo/Idh/MocA family oxidoreductase [Candidatus Gastranaerophilaceae bacterium]|jgi:UDP-2-acetamido-3-amino-2,3-dideoxy-glucuronate N-acetyltransferase|nr:gfo/Idh/MocA family oxidoreductase [bacterium]MEE0495567.1 Gfo/Idh/MocA family oxidoreductase [Cyanobacteriota bacterium]CDE92570.1 oxidoreductase domain protein [Fusobacterium sp. CAG:815]DAA93948.1 MAG TPA: gfo/Idh/MocA family oxidoreductase [Candidatus Gastranaerophilales bacterium HUM_6]DAA95374.1 MAG TPA: gfo/Idh/MocA family oxidoreductase [Candidatus Gastranaerophilales bacterium HUM_7]DAB01089.1 MAG TPA: gfo/Idh/MocA family oxidoreductase [Candidatus Gastranaerophilales bacterium HUM